jgi:hypothetical protein
MKRFVQTVLVAVFVATALGRFLAAQPAPVPTPASVFGFAPCDDHRLATYEEIATYFRHLDAASDRMRLFEIGTTAEGRTQLLAVVSSEANLARLDRYKDIARRLALARELTDEQARALARKRASAVMWVDFGLHSSELAHAQTAPLMAWRAVTEETEEWKAIRDQVLFVLVPNMNPDGTTQWAEWYRRSTSAGRSSGRRRQSSTRSTSGTTTTATGSCSTCPSRGTSRGSSTSSGTRRSSTTSTSRRRSRRGSSSRRSPTR